MNNAPDSRTRRAGGWGLLFVVLLLIGAGMVSVPGRDSSVPQVRQFYDQHAGVILLSQAVELIATVPLVLFLMGLAASKVIRTRRDATFTGAAVVLASLLTLVPPVLLVLLRGRGSTGTVHALVVLSDLSDVLLFAAIAGFAAICGWAGHGPTWLRWLALVIAVASAARAVEILIGGGVLAVVAPLGFILLVVAFSIVLLRSGRRATLA